MIIVVAIRGEGGKRAKRNMKADRGLNGAKLVHLFTFSLVFTVDSSIQAERIFSPAKPNKSRNPFSLLFSLLHCYTHLANSFITPTNSVLWKRSGAELGLSGWLAGRPAGNSRASIFNSSAKIPRAMKRISRSLSETLALLSQSRKLSR